MTTFAPSATNRWAVARPMPLLPPVIRAILPASLICASWRLQRAWHERFPLRRLSRWRLRLRVASEPAHSRAAEWLCVPRLRSPRLVNRQARRDGLMDGRGHAVPQASPNDAAAQRLHLETTAIFEVARHRGSPLRGERRRLRDDSIDGVSAERSPCRPSDGDDLRA